MIRLYAAWLPGVSASDYLLTSDADIWPIAPRGVYHFNSARNWSAKKVHLYNAFCCGLIRVPFEVSLPHCRAPSCKKKIMRLNTKMYPIGYIGMQARHWRDVMGNTEAITGRSSLSLSELAQLTADTISAEAKMWKYDPSKDGIKSSSNSQWFCDQYLFSQRIALWPEYPLSVEEISRNTNIDRIDRSLWPSADAIRSG